MRILVFLLDNLFFALVGAALLRAWMNSARVRMTEQPGRFVMAVTDWLVVPLRRALPRRWSQAVLDWGSLLAAVLLALAYALIWHALVPLAVHGWTIQAWWFGVPVMALSFLLRTALQGLWLITLLYAVLSWVQPHGPVQATLSRLIEPLLQPLRRRLPTVGGVDLSALVLLLLLQVALMLLN
jgi:YggT family protein